MIHTSSVVVAAQRLSNICIESIVVGLNGLVRPSNQIHRRAVHLITSNGGSGEECIEGTPLKYIRLPWNILPAIWKSFA